MMKRKLVIRSSPLPDEWTLAPRATDACVPDSLRVLVGDWADLHISLWNC